MNHSGTSTQPLVTVNCVNAVSLRSTQTFGKQDPYVKVIYGRSTRKTRVHDDGSRNPTWNQKIVMGTIPLNGLLKLEVWNENNMSDCVIGVASMKIATNSYQGAVSIPLTHKNKSAGTLNIELTITSENGGAVQQQQRPQQSRPQQGGFGGAAMAVAGTQLFRAAVAGGPTAAPQYQQQYQQQPRAPVVATAYAMQPPQVQVAQVAQPIQAQPIQAQAMNMSQTTQGSGLRTSTGAHFVSQDKSIISTDTSNDVQIPLGAGADLTVGLGWDFADVDGDGQGDTDLDLSCVAFNSRGQYMNACYFAEANPFGNNAVRHTGDNRDGKGDGDDETIVLDLDKLHNAGVSGKYSKRRRSNVAVIIVRKNFIRYFFFFFFCLLLNRSFQTNPNSVTNYFQLFSLYCNLQLHCSCVAF